ncbi:MAG: hypothetical protein HYY04_00950 [Chloroflexi bacterium]|nr:hypothetical protein [Chloroflexota bacterium]
MARRLSRRHLLGTLVGGVVLVVGAACSRESVPTSGVLVAWPARNVWPDQFWQAAPAVQEAYRYALGNPQILQYFPCYCGCGEQGHTSNKDCYIREVRADGSVVLDPMSFG